MSYNNSMLEPNITESVRSMAAAHPGAPLYAIGHSMGAALATICAMDVKFKANLTDVRLYTFGSPRVGNAEFAKFVYNQTKASCCAQHSLSACKCLSTDQSCAQPLPYGLPLLTRSGSSLVPDCKSWHFLIELCD